MSIQKETENPTGSNRNIVGKKLLIRVLQVSTCITILFTAISFYLDYKEEKKILSDTKIQIQSKLIDNLSMSVFNFDEIAIKIQINSLMSAPEIISVSLFDEDGKQVERAGPDTTAEKYTETWNYPLLKPDKDKEKQHKLGALSVLVTKKFMYRRIARKMLYFFMSQGLKTLIVSLILLWIFNRLIVRHLLNISGNLQEFRKGDYKSYKSVELNISRKDELTRLNDLLNELCNIVSEKLNDANKEILLQKANAINSAKLASIGEMAGGIAHEINNPLAVIHGSVQLISRAVNGSEKIGTEVIAQLCDRIQTMIGRISSIVKGLKYFSRDGRLDSYENASTANLVYDAVSLCREKFTSFGVSINLDEVSDFHIQCKIVQIGQVFLNILNNAFDALSERENPMILVSVTEHGQFVNFKLKNNGPPIPKEQREKILEPFVTTKEIGKGTGLGLSISVGIVENHGGSITIFDEGPLTVFCVRLPKIQGESGAGPEIKDQVA